MVLRGLSWRLAFTSRSRTPAAIKIGALTYASQQPVFGLYIQVRFSAAHAEAKPLVTAKVRTSVRE